MLWRYAQLLFRLKASHASLTSSDGFHVIKYHWNIPIKTAIAAPHLMILVFLNLFQGEQDGCWVKEIFSVDLFYCNGAPRYQYQQTGALKLQILEELKEKTVGFWLFEEWVSIPKSHYLHNQILWSDKGLLNTSRSCKRFSFDGELIKINSK